MTSRTYDPIPARDVAFLGLGVMGYPMAGHLARAGHRVTVYNRTAAKAAAWVAEYGGAARRRRAQAAAGADIVFACVGNDDDLRSVVLGDSGAFAGMSAGAIFVDHTTASAAVARELARRGGGAALHFIDAPVSGGNLGAINGALTVMCGGDAAAFDDGQAGGDGVREGGDAARRRAAPGQLAKMVNQIAIAGLVQGLAEAIAFGEQAGLDMKAVLERDRQGRGAELADGQPRPDDDRRQVRLRLRGRLDAQGPRPRARRGAPQRRAPAGDRAGRPVLRRRAGRRAAGAGTRRA